MDVYAVFSDGTASKIYIEFFAPVPKTYGKNCIIKLMK